MATPAEIQIREIVAALTVYDTRDLFTDPPTAIKILRGPAPSSDQPAALPDGTWLLHECDVEPTAGWSNRDVTHSTNLSVCFMHSYGKCHGRGGSGPSSCLQLHVKPDVLRRLRARYTLPSRAFFTRTVKAAISGLLHDRIQRQMSRRLSMEYFEFLVSDVAPSVGCHVYDSMFREWLTSDSALPFQCHDVVLCDDFALYGTCRREDRCPHVHAVVETALTRDKSVVEALRAIGSRVARSPPAMPAKPSYTLPSRPASAPPEETVSMDALMGPADYDLLNKILAAVPREAAIAQKPTKPAAESPLFAQLFWMSSRLASH